MKRAFLTLALLAAPLLAHAQAVPIQDLPLATTPLGSSDLFSVTQGNVFHKLPGTSLGAAAGLGTMATQNANAVAITGGTVTGVAITGASGTLTGHATLDLAIFNNLSDVGSVVSARTNLGLGTMATQNANNVAITGGTITGVTITGHSSLDLAIANNLSDVASASTAATNLGLGAASAVGFASLTLTSNPVYAVSGATANGNCVEFGTGNILTDTGEPCSSGGGGGSVISVGMTVPGSSIFGVTGSPITTAGTIGLTTTGTSGGIPYFSSTSQLSSSAALAANAIVLGKGAGVAPATTTTGTGVITAIGNATNGTGGLVTFNGNIGTTATGHSSLDLLASNNLSDVGSAATSRSNLSILPHVATNAALAASSIAAYPSGVWRDDYASGNTAPPLWFLPQSGTCVANGFANDGGTCVNDASGNSWLVPLSPTFSEDIREWGAIPYSNSSANSTALTAIFATPRSLSVFIPPMTFGISCGINYTRTATTITITGAGPQSVLQLGATACVGDFSWLGNGLFIFDAASYSTLKNFTIDMNGLTASGGSAVSATSSSATISGTTLSVGGTITGTWAVGEVLSASTVAPGTYITALGSGSGGAGTYTVNISQTVVNPYPGGAPNALNGTPGIATATAASISGTTLTVGGTVTGTWGVGQTIWAATVPTRQYHITALGSGSGGAGTYTLSGSPGTLGPQTMLGEADIMSIVALNGTSGITYDFAISGVRIVNGNAPTLFPISVNAFSNYFYNLTIENNYIAMTPSVGEPLVAGNQCIGEAGQMGIYNQQINNNSCVGSGLQITGLQGGILSGNNIEQFAFGSGIYCTDFSSGSATGTKWNVYGNHIHDGAATLDVSGQGTAMSGIEWHCPDSTIEGNLIEHNGGPGIVNSADNVSILSNHINDNASNQVNPAIRGGIFLEAAGTGNNSIGTAIDGNSIYSFSGNQQNGLIIGGSVNTSGIIFLGTNRLSAPNSEIVNNSPQGNAVYGAVHLPQISFGTGFGDDTLIYNADPGATGVVNIEAGHGGTDYFFSFRRTGEFDAGIACIGGSCNGVTSLGALNLSGCCGIYMNGNQFANRGDTSSIDGLIELQSPAAHSFTPAIDMNVAGASTGLQILRDTTLSNFWAVKTITGGLDLGLFVDNDSTHGIHIHSGTGLTSIPGGIGIGDDNLIYNPGSGVVNIEAGISGTDYFYSFRKTGEFDAGLVCIGGTCDGVTALGALNLHAGPIYISGTPGITKTCTVIPTGMTIQGGIITAVTGGTCI